LGREQLHVAIGIRRGEVNLWPSDRFVDHGARQSASWREAGRDAFGAKPLLRTACVAQQIALTVNQEQVTVPGVDCR